MANNAEVFPPSPPTFSDELVEQCKRDSDFRPILFEWYKYITILCNQVAHLTLDSPALRKVPAVHYAVLTGLLNRCSRLMLANTRLSCTRRYGETTRLLDRSIVESAIKVQWLCHKDDPNCFQRYIANGLKRDLELKYQIEENIRKRGGENLVIETRMLRSIQEFINLSGLSEQDVNDAKPLHDFASMCRDLNLSNIFYAAIQKMGSHAVHGTWSDLVVNYLRHDATRGFFPRDHDVDTQDVQYMAVSNLVLEALEKFLSYVATDPSEMKDLISIINSVESKLIEIQDLAWSSDFSKE